ncbi:hypothetical protein [Corynebacterium timonense]|uniref:Uncharacterized protein n=1 Tax=Corynebacterium timonense TaxID=441500 RepID=A0A1H1QJ25_9CORY|nr:hypothetical protein [Corynebacterium timonense]SDS23337.1 hypothetical protein SAMN04488539_1272 [Corynebacterium timonense]
MASEHYVLSPSAWGAAVEVPVQKLVQATLFSDFTADAGSRATRYIDVALQPDPVGGAWRVRYAGGILGEIDAADRGRFLDIHAVYAAGLVPETLAGVRLDRDSGLFGVSVFFPPAPLAVPRNDAPSGSRVLPPGDMFPVDTSSGEVSAAEIAAASPGQWLVGLQLLDGTVVVTLGGRVLGHLPDEDSGAVAPLLRDAPAAAFSARAHFLDGMVGLDLDAQASATAEAAALPRLGPRPDPATGAEVTQFPDGTWAVTTAGEDVAAYLTGEGGARRVSTPPAPSVDFTPTKSWSVSAGRYLSEVEKVRLRRQADGRVSEGRHRLVD